MSNPIQRDMLVEVAFGADLTADPTTWSWTDVSGDVLSQSIAIQRGRADEASETQPMTTSLTLDNISGDYTPDNPVGVYYPDVRRGTPMRISVPGESYFRVGDPESARFTTADAAPLDITGDIDVRVDFLISEIDAHNDLLGKYGFAGERSWFFVVDDNSLLRLWWSEDGTAMKQVASTVPVPTGVRAAYRVTLDVNNGAGGHTLTFYSAATIDGPWAQFGDPVVGSGITSIYSSTTELEVGDVTTFPVTKGKIWAAQVYDGIEGTLVANADFRDLEPGTTGFTDSVGRVWSSAGGAAVDNTYVRFFGHVDEWAPSWPAGDVTGTVAPHSVCDITASSARRRLAQGASQIDSALRQTLPAIDGLLAYWPLEDGPNATSFGSATGGPMMSFLGSPVPAAYSDYPASAPLPTFDGAGAIGSVPAYVDTGGWTVSCVVVMPESGTTDEAVLLDVHTSGTAARWLVKYEAGANQIRTQVFSSATPPVELTNQTTSVTIDGRAFLLYLEGEQNGSDVAGAVGVAPVVSFSEVPSVTAPVLGGLTSQTSGRVIAVGVGTALDLSDGVAVGHVAVYDRIQVFFFTDAYRALIAWAGETAVDRFLRLATAAGLDAAIAGDTGDPSELMGVQPSTTLVEALQECADSDVGIFLDRRHTPGLLFRPRWSLYNQDPVLVLDAAESGIANPFQPILDDQRIRNDVTVVRAGGGSSRAVDQVSVDAEGRYEDSVTVSLFTDAQTLGQAWWRLHLGTVPGMRYSTITVDFDTAPEEVRVIWVSRGVDVGDLIRVQNLPRQHAPDDLDLIIQGYTETISRSRWQVTFNCSPAEPYRVGVYDGEGTLESRYDTAGSELDEDLTTTETDVTVATTSGPVWTQAAGDLPFDVVCGGERMTVTAVSGTTSPQTFTVTRSVNGVVKAHSSGAAVQLAEPVYYAL